MRYRVDFTKIGRDPTPKTITVDAADLDDLAQQVIQYVRPQMRMLVGSDDLAVNLQPLRGFTGVGQIFAGFQDAGRFTFTGQETET